MTMKIKLDLLFITICIIGVGIEAYFHNTPASLWAFCCIFSAASNLIADLNNDNN